MSYFIFLFVTKKLSERLVAELGPSSKRFTFLNKNFETDPLKFFNKQISRYYTLLEFSNKIILYYFILV